VTRRFLPILFTVAAATLAAGCTTFSDNNAAARVGDDELTDEMLEELVGMIPDPQTGGPGDPTSGGSVRNALTFWIRAQVLEQLVSDADLEIDTTLRDQAAQQASQLTGYEQLSGDSQDFVVDWYTSTAAFDTVAAPDDAAKVAFYEQGMETTGIACVSHILVETEAEADEILAELAEGADFPTLAQERSIDPGSGAQGGVLQCTLLSTFESQFVPPFVQASRVAVIGVPTDPVESQFGFHVIRVRTYDEVSDELGPYFASPDFAIALAITGTDVYVDPRYGALNEGGVVVPLG
jgi:foldase protein PrsA